MMYEALAPYYDALVKDEEATLAWADLIESKISNKKILELACGSGEITIELAKRGYEMHASDLSKYMIEEAKKKDGAQAIDFFVMDMCDFTCEDVYDGIICLCDSFNYILKDEDVTKLFHNVYNHLKVDGVFIMDMHSLDRLEEFYEEYNETGHAYDVDIQWTIQSDEDRIYQNFAFYNEDGNIILEQHIQRVYDPIKIKEQLEGLGFDVTIYTDFDLEGIQEGEKQFYICKKK